MGTITRTDLKRKILSLYSEELEYLVENRNIPVFDKPDLRIASATDPVISNLKKVIGSYHWTPDEALKNAFPGKSFSAKSVISWCLPISERARVTNREEKNKPSIEWAWTRTNGENMNNRMRSRLSEWLMKKGYPSTAPVFAPDFEAIQSAATGISSPWSERHYAWAAGHGTFGISGGLITRHGIAHRLGSVVTTLPIEPDHREYGDDPFGWCLKSSKGTCGICIKRCPSGSIGENHQERDKILCDEYYLQKINHQYGELYNWEGIYGCGLCQTKVPCEYKKP